MRTLTSVTGTIALIVGIAQAATCWYPDGKTQEPNHVPCNATISDSACCDPADACSQSGICLGKAGFNYRGSCTDQSWHSSNCPSQCRTDPLSGDNAYNQTTFIFPCNNLGGGSNDFCCQSGDGSCCSKNFTYGSTGPSFTVGMDQIVRQLFLKSNSSSTRGNATGSTPSATTFPGSNNNVGASIGAAVGIPLVAVAIGVVGFIFWKERRKQRIEEAAVQAEDVRQRRARDDADRARQEKRKREEEDLFDDNEPITPRDAVLGPSPAPASPHPRVPPRRAPPSPTIRGGARGLARMPLRGGSRATNTVLSRGQTSDVSTRGVPQNRSQGSGYLPYNPDSYRPNREHDDLDGLL